MVKTRQVSAGARQAAVAGAIFVGVIILFWLSLRIPGLANFYERLQAGVVRLGTGFGNGVTRVMVSENSWTQKYAKCEADTRQLALGVGDYAALEREVQELRTLVGYLERTSAEGVVAQVIARSVDDDSTRILIDQGLNDGLLVGSAVVIDEGVLFGLIESVRETTAVVKLVNSEQSNLPAAVLGRNRTIGLVEGRGGALLVMEYIPQDAELGSGNLVVTSGLDSLVPQGLVIGLVTEVISVESAPFQRAFIELLYEPREWTTVLVLPPPGL